MDTWKHGADPPTTEVLYTAAEHYPLYMPNVQYARSLTDPTWISRVPSPFYLSNHSLCHVHILAYAH